MDYLSLFQPISHDIVPEEFNREQLGSSIQAFTAKSGFPDNEDKRAPDFVLMGANLYGFLPPENKSVHVPDSVRRHLYGLFTGTFRHVHIADWGNIRSSDDAQDNKHKVVEALRLALEQRSIPILLGGGQELTALNYSAYKELKRYFNLLGFDPKADLDINAGADSFSEHLNPIVFDADGYLFNYGLVGYQNYLVAPSIVETMDRLFFELLRLGDVRQNPEIAEPIIRDADCISLDMGSIKASDAPAVLHPEPNGFRAEEICKMARYCGMNKKLSSFGLYNISPTQVCERTSRLAAEIIWHVLDGYYNRVEESADFSSSQFLRYDVSSPEMAFDIRFYKNRLTGRWWISLPLNEEGEIKYGFREYIVPCSEQDYLEALQGEIPERWLKAEKKLNFK
jgi:arginase family enzyme